MKLYILFLSLFTSACIVSDNALHHHHTLDYVELTVHDLEAAKRFYGEAFGWRFNDYGPEYAGIQRHDGQGEVGGMVPGEVVPGGPLLILYSDDLESSVRAVTAAGGTITVEPFPFPGGRRFHFRDPAGNELAVWAEPEESSGAK